MNRATPSRATPLRGLRRLLAYPLERLGLRFADPATERAFVECFALGDIRQTQAAMLLGSVVFLAFSAWDRVIDPVGAERVFTVRACIVAFVLLPATASLFFPFYRRSPEAWLLAFCAVPAVGLSAICSLLDGGFVHGAAGMVIVILFVFTLLPMRTPFFAAFCAAAWGSFEIAQAGADLPAGTPIVNGMILGAAVLLGLYSAATRERSARREFLADGELEASRARVEELLHSVLPRDIVRRIQSGETAIAEAHGEVSIVICDLVGFTAMSRSLSPDRLVAILDRLFARFDEEAGRHGIEKIKTIGDAYLAVAGLDGGDDDHPQRAALFALALQRSVAEISTALGTSLHMRVGLHVGPIVAGVIGIRRPAFDCWGDTVNVASRLETLAEPGRVLVSEAAYARLSGRFSAVRVDGLHLKGIGPTAGYVLDEAGSTLRPEALRSLEGRPAEPALGEAR